MMKAPPTSIGAPCMLAVLDAMESMCFGRLVGLGEIREAGSSLHRGSRARCVFERTCRAGRKSTWLARCKDLGSLFLRVQIGVGTFLFKRKQSCVLIKSDSSDLVLAMLTVSLSGCNLAPKSSTSTRHRRPWLTHKLLQQTRKGREVHQSTGSSEKHECAVGDHPTAPHCVAQKAVQNSPHERLCCNPSSRVAVAYHDSQRWPNSSCLCWEEAASPQEGLCSLQDGQSPGSNGTQGKPTPAGLDFRTCHSNKDRTSFN